MAEGHDVIIVGAGAAGATLAARLSENPDIRVLLLEAGGKARGPLFSVPLMTGVLLRSRIANWGYVTEPQQALGGRRLNWPRGKGLGGSTAINGMVWMRGLRSDFDGWAQLGLRGWSFAEVEPIFRGVERTPHRPAEMGQDGPIDLSRAPLGNPLFAVWLQAAQQAGHPLTANLNGAEPAGFGLHDFAIRNGRRRSTARAFLDPAAGRPNLTVETRAPALRVAVERGRAIGVIVARGGREQLIHAEREVVFCAGAVGSPQLLMLSGVGPADDLRRLGIAPVAELSGVGRNLQDHCLVRVCHAATSEAWTYDDLRRVDRAALALLRAYAFGTGPAATFPIEVGGLLKSDPAFDLPDIQSAFLPGLTSAALRLPFIGMAKPAVGGRGFFANAFPMRPESRGEIRLRSADPREPPLIDPRYLTAEGDLRRTRAAVRLLRDIFRQPAFERFRGPETAPGPGVSDDGSLDAWIRATADTVFHPVGTCAMGPDRDPEAVLDAELRVRGVERLRVADASAMPRLTSCNTMAPTIMIAERCAGFMRGGNRRSDE